MIGRAAIVVFACIGISDITYNRPGQLNLVGGFQQPMSEEEVIAELPFASTEQALIVYDEASKTEHLILELRYDKTNASFGLLVPVPGTPTVEKVSTAPFDQLRDIYTFSEPGLGLGIGLGGLDTSMFGRMGGGAGVGSGSGSGSGFVEPPPPPAVEVLDEHPVGAFTSFTLAIHDASELDAWLKEKGFATAKSVGEWADRYARMDFAFVALKYTAPDGGSGTTSQTVRISFSTPQPFFPYSEPVAPKLTKRLTAAWVIAPNAVRPVARLEEKKTVAQPWRSGMRFTASHDELATIFKELASIIPAGDKLSVQTYRDWKTSRAGWGDVLFVPYKPAPLDDVAKAEKRRLLGVLDPDLVPPPKPKPVAIASSAPIPSASVAPAASSSTAAKSGCGGCNASGSAPSPFALLALAIVFFGRKRAMALLALVGCSKTPTPSAADVEAVPSASASAASIDDAAPAPASTLSADDEKAHVESAFETLSGDVPEAGVAILAGTAPIPPPIPYTTKNPTVPSVSTGSFVVQGPIAVDYVRRILAQHRAQLRYCYERGLQRDPSIKGTIQMKFVINARGDVVSSVAGGGTLSSSEVQGCAANVVRNTQFPAGDGGSITMVSFTITMNPGY